MLISHSNPFLFDQDQNYIDEVIIYGFFIHPLSILVYSRTSDPRQRGTLEITLFEINECTLSPAGGGSSSIKIKF
jgi:hypothetical protein